MYLGVQPARAALVAQRYTDRLAAEAIHVDVAHFRNAIKGVAHPSNAIRERLPVLLGVPLGELFTQESLSRPYLVDLGYRVRGKGEAK